MPNYNLVATTMFEPYSYERYLQPFQAYSEAYKEQEDILADLQVKANIWEGMANEQTDPDTYAKYKKYADDLKTQADALASQGLTPTSRRDMLNLRSRYSAEITPIEQAYTQRAELQKTQREALLRDPSLIFENDLSDPTIASLDNFVGNPNYGYGNVYSGEKLREDVSKAAKNLSSTLRSKNKSGAELRRRLQMVLPYQYRLLEERGFDSDEVLAAIANDENASSILRDLIEGAVDTSGIKNWGSEENVNRARAYAAQGLWDAIGTPTEKWLTDTYNMQRAKADGDGGDGGQTSLYKYPFDYGTIEAEDVLKKHTSAINGLYVDVDPKVTGGQAKKAFDTRFLGPNKNLNPMAVYDYFEQWLDMHPEYNVQPMGGVKNIRTGEIDPMWQQFIDDRNKAFKQETGVDVNNIISQEQYEALEDLGYSSTDNVKVFTDGSIEKDLDDLIHLYRPSRLNLANYDSPNFNHVLNVLRDKANADNESIVKEYSTGNSIKPKKIIDNDTKIVDVAYDLRLPEDVILSLRDKNGSVKKYAVNLAVLDPTLPSLFRAITQDEQITVRGKQIPKYMRDKESYTRRQNVGVETLRGWADNFLPNLSETTSKLRP